MQGGLAVVDENRIISRWPLPVAGLMSDRPADEVAANFFDIEDSVRKLGCTLAAPFGALAFIALPVIPELRLTDLGIVDVNAFKLVQA